MSLLKKTQIRSFFALGLAMAFMVFLLSLMIFSFNEYKNTIVAEQEKQLLTISKAVSNSISQYTDFYFQELEQICTFEEYRREMDRFALEGNESGIRSILDQNMRLQTSDVTNYILMEDTEAFETGGKGLQWDEAFVYTSLNRFSGKGEGCLIDVLRDQNDCYYLGLSRPAGETGLRLYFVIDIDQMYQKVASYIKVGTNGYVMIKDSTGRILMHPSEEQIGEDVIEGRAQMYPEFDLSELALLIQHQKEGREGTEIYHSYWWPQEKPRRVKKIAAYTPVWFGDDFLIVSAVIDYNEIAQPVSRAMLTVGFLAIVIATCFLCILYWLVVSARARRRVELENEHLRRLNVKLKELRVRQNQIAHDQRLQLIGKLTGGIAHEFNNLLTPIMGYSGLLMAESKEGDETYDSAQEIYNAAQKAKEIISQIAALSRKNVDISAKPLNIKKAMDRVLKMVDTVAPNNVRLDLSMEWEEDSCILCSETSLNQIILNLCANAFYAMRGREGVLSLSGFQVQKNNRTYACIAVKDTGEGMSKETIQQIFDPFFTTKQVGEGTGLGLSTVQGILESLEGSITVESIPDKGSCFRIYLPLIKAGTQSQAPAVSEKTNAAARGKSVLLIEDDRRILKLFQKGLKEAGFLVTAIQDPLQAKEVLKNSSFDVIVTDYAMPKMNGAQIAFLAKSMGLNCKVIMVTGLAEDKVLDYCQKNLIHQLLLKPVEVEALIEAINREL